VFGDGEKANLMNLEAVLKKRARSLFLYGFRADGTWSVLEENRGVVVRLEIIYS
jgi:hypothetical protein